MPYQLSMSLALGSSQTGLSLEAQLVDTSGANVGAPVTTGFVEVGAGNYLWTYSGFPDGFRGGVVFKSSGQVKAFVAINPEEAELLDVRVSSVSVPGSGAGAIPFQYTVYKPDGVTPLEGVDVWVTTDQAGQQVVAGTLTTDTFGRVVFYLDAGTYYFWRQAPGWNFDNPDVEVVG